MFLQTFQDSEDPREPECGSIERHENLCKCVTDDGIEEVIEPVIFVSVSAEGVFGPMVQGVYVVPQVWDDVKGSMSPVHSERHDVVIENEPGKAFLQ